VETINLRHLAIDCNRSIDCLTHTNWAPQCNQESQSSQNGDSNFLNTIDSGTCFFTCLFQSNSNQPKSIFPINLHVPIDSAKFFNWAMAWTTCWNPVLIEMEKILSDCDPVTCDKLMNRQVYCLHDLRPLLIRTVAIRTPYKVPSFRNIFVSICGLSYFQPFQCSNPRKPYQKG